MYTEGLIFGLNIDGLSYNITDYTGSDTDIIIPDEYNGLPVTLIDSLVFQNKDLTSVVIGKNITKLTSKQFYNNNLTTITVPQNVTQISNNAFNYNPLTDIYIENIAPIQITARSFFVEHSSIIEEPIIHVSSLQPAFYISATMYTSQSFGQHWENLANWGRLVYDIVSDFDIEYINEQCMILGYSGSETDIVIPSGIDVWETTVIDSYAFQEKSLTSVKLPKTLTRIEHGAFYNNSLTEIELPDTLEYIGEGAFQNNNITNIVIPKGVTSILTNAFYNNPTEYVKLHEGVVEIFDYAFSIVEGGRVDLWNIYPPMTYYNSFGNTNTFFDQTIHLPIDAEPNYAAYNSYPYTWNTAYQENGLVFDLEIPLSTIAELKTNRPLGEKVRTRGTLTGKFYARNYAFEDENGDAMVIYALDDSQLSSIPKDTEIEIEGIYGEYFSLPEIIEPFEILSSVSNKPITPINLNTFDLITTPLEQLDCKLVDISGNVIEVMETIYSRQLRIQNENGTFVIEEHSQVITEGMEQYTSFRSLNIGDMFIGKGLIVRDPNRNITGSEAFIYLTLYTEVEQPLPPTFRQLGTAYFDTTSLEGETKGYRFVKQSTIEQLISGELEPEVGYIYFSNQSNYATKQDIQDAIYGILDMEV